MPSQAKKSPLASLIDDIWQGRTVRKPPADIPVLTDENWLLLGAWNAAACFGPPSGNLKFSQDRVEIADDWGKLLYVCKLATVGAISKQDAQIEFLGTSIGVLLTNCGGAVPNHKFHHDPWALICALDLITHHLDSVLLKPRDLREDSLANFAMRAGLDLDHFRRLCSWHSQILPYV